MAVLYQIGYREVYFTNQKFLANSYLLCGTRLPPNLDLRTFSLLFEIYDGAAKALSHYKKSTKKIPGNEDANRYQNTPLK